MFNPFPLSEISQGPFSNHITTESCIIQAKEIVTFLSWTKLAILYLIFQWFWISFPSIMGHFLGFRCLKLILIHICILPMRNLSNCKISEICPASMHKLIKSDICYIVVSYVIIFLPRYSLTRFQLAEASNLHPSSPIELFSLLIKTYKDGVLTSSSIKQTTRSARFEGLVHWLS